LSVGRIDNQQIATIDSRKSLIDDDFTHFRHVLIIMSITDLQTVKFRDSIAEFNHIRANALSGNLVIQVPDLPSWMLCFSSGRLAGISGGIDAIERWERNLALASLNMPLDRLVKSTNHQEIFLNSNKIAQECAVAEVLFDIIQFSQLKGDRLQYRFISIDFKQTQIKSVVPLLEIQPILSVAIQSWQEWEKQGLASYAPSLFPTIQKSMEIPDLDRDIDLQYLISSVNGTKSLRSLAIHHQKKLITVAKSLLPFLKAGQIVLSTARANLPSQDTNINSNVILDVDRVKISLPRLIDLDQTATKSTPLIACIDDSISVYKNLEKIINGHGYRCFGVQDPLKIISSLIKNKPDLILLDLVMPITNGYEVCEQIRKTPSLANVPIIILTGNDGLIDRVRTKFVGSNGFLGKPIQPELVLKTIDKYLDKSEKQSIKIISDRDKATSTNRSDRYQQEQLNNTYKRVLVVDDDRSIREVVSMCLHKLKGWDVLTVASGQEGLAEIYTKNPDVIILDVMMPEMDGLAFLRNLRANTATKTIPVVLLTANRYLPDKDLLSELGVVEIVSKPFLPIDLVRQIDRALEGNSCLV
jgi:two-component system, chemotaxis family, response regulator PixG